MGRKPTAERLSEAVRTMLAKHPGVEVHGPSLRIWFMWRGKRCRESLGLEPTKANIKYAAGRRAAVTHAIKIGTFDYGEWFPGSKHANGARQVRNARVSEVAQRYIELKSVDITSGTQERYQTALDAVVEILGGNVLVATLTLEDVQLMRGELAGTRQVSTANHYLSVAAGFLRWCKDNGYTELDLASGANKIRAEDVEPDPFTQAEFQALTKACHHPQDVAAITLAVYTGMRPGEICGLAREDVDLDTGCLTVRRSITRSGEIKVPKTKQSRDRIIWLLPPALDAVRSLLSITEGLEPKPTTVSINRHQARVETVAPLISPSTQARQPKIGTWMTPHTWSCKVARILTRSGVRRRRPYQTRHTFACWSLTAHGNLAFIAKQMGHKDYSMLVKIYAKWIDSESKSEAGRIWKEMKKSGAFAPLMPHEKEGQPETP